MSSKFTLRLTGHIPKWSFTPGVLSCKQSEFTPRIFFFFVFLRSDWLSTGQFEGCNNTGSFRQWQKVWHSFNRPGKTYPKFILGSQAKGNKRKWINYWSLKLNAISFGLFLLQRRSQVWFFCNLKLAYYNSFQYSSNLSIPSAAPFVLFIPSFSFFGQLFSPFTQF